MKWTTEQEALWKRALNGGRLTDSERYWIWQDGGEFQKDAEHYLIVLTDRW